MLQKTVFDFAKKLMADKEFLAGGIMHNEREWLDNIGFEYTVSDGCVHSHGEDLSEFYSAMQTLLDLQKKYERRCV